MELLGVWLAAARDAGEPLPDAMSLATITPDGWPSARMVMLRGLDRGVTFFTDSGSDKGAELAAVPRAAALLHWLAPQHRQVRIVGEVEPVGAAEAERYWRTRPPEVRRTAAASAQSQVIASRAELEQRRQRPRPTLSRRRFAAPPRSVDRIPDPPRHHRVLAGGSRPPARPIPIPPGGGIMGRGATFTLTARWP